MAESKTSKVHHPVFARLYARMAKAFEAKGAAEHRDEALAGIGGRVVEVGAGTGANFVHYPSSVSEVVAVEPEPYLRDLAAKAAASAPVSVTVLDGVADCLPLDDGSCDVGVASLVLCSVEDQGAALAELRRVIRPGGELRFFEHVRADTPGFARFQRVVDVVWPYLGGGCHASRDTLAAIAAAGFDLETARRFTFRPSLTVAPVAPHVIGVARRP
ncbi:MAG TPA: class I SAM-dependent methyltransferase [Acidimicrobiales bacterium]|nr:class I SAM-dependent methyltransferase [Acidimicrobiales bacterium]